MEFTGFCSTQNKYGVKGKRWELDTFQPEWPERSASAALWVRTVLREGLGPLPLLRLLPQESRESKTSSEQPRRGPRFNPHPQQFISRVYQLIFCEFPRCLHFRLSAASLSLHDVFCCWCLPRGTSCVCENWVGERDFVFFLFMICLILVRSSLAACSISSHI